MTSCLYAHNIFPSLIPCKELRDGCFSRMVFSHCVFQTNKHNNHEK